LLRIWKKSGLENIGRFIVSQIGGNECQLGTECIKLGTEGSSEFELENPSTASSPNDAPPHTCIIVRLPAHAQQELMICILSPEMLFVCRLEGSLDRLVAEFRKRRLCFKRPRQWRKES
jgi:hypothetical protein